MKNFMGRSVGIAAAAAFTSAAFASPLTDISSTSLTSWEHGSPAAENPTGDSYFWVPAVGNTGFGTTGTYGNSTFDLVQENIGTSVLGDGVDTTETLADNAGGNYTLSISLIGAGGTDLAPNGLTVGGVAANRAGFFLGANAGGDPLDFAGGDTVIVNSGTINLFDAGGTSLTGGELNMDLATFFQDLPGGAWGGSFGIVFGAGTTGLGINHARVTINLDVIPEPGSLLLLGLGAISVLRRR